MKWAVAIVIGVLAAIFFGYGGYDQWATMTNYQPHLDAMAAYPDGEAMLAWAQGLPIWRMALWGLTNLFGVLGGLLLLGRIGASSILLWLAVLGFGGGFGLDVALLDGMDVYGQPGLIFAGVSFVVLVLFALGAGWAVKR